MAKIVQILNIGSKNSDPAQQLLSNFARCRIVVAYQGVTVEANSVEGFLQALKFPWKNPDRMRTLKLWGVAALRMGRQAESIYGYNSIYWGNREVLRNSLADPSEEHLHLIYLALLSKYSHNDECRSALLSTEGKILTHYLGRVENPQTSLPAQHFMSLLYTIRDEIQAPAS